ncbi:MAG: four helix bundle protein [Pedosphaera sp.]|nr:four helix bundle protein [Pedosphaera sp.]
MNVIRHHWQLEVYKLSVDAAMQIFQLTMAFPREEMYSLTDQIRRSSRSVSGQIAEGWRKRKYEASFVNKLNDAEGEAAETQSWIEYAVKCDYMERKVGRELHRLYDRILGKLVNMGNNPGPWLLQKTRP